MRFGRKQLLQPFTMKDQHAIPTSEASTTAPIALTSRSETEATDARRRPSGARRGADQGSPPSARRPKRGFIVHQEDTESLVIAIVKGVNKIHTIRFWCFGLLKFREKTSKERCKAARFENTSVFSTNHVRLTYDFRQWKRFKSVVVRAELPDHALGESDIARKAAPNTKPTSLTMFARVARVAAVAAAKKAPAALAARCAASPFASTAVRALQTREKSTLGSLLKVRARLAMKHYMCRACQY